MDDVMLYISRETKEKREYLINFSDRMETMKLDGIRVNAYKIGISEEPNFWKEMYEDDKLPEEKCKRKNIRIGKEYQINLHKLELVKNIK